MKINGVSTKQYYRGIPLYKWESVQAALNRFASGSTKGSRETEKKQVLDIGVSKGGFAQAFYLLYAPHVQGADNPFVESLLAEAKAGIESRGCWSKSYDYDGMGVFFKTGVEIEELSEALDLYNLKIWAAYVGDEPEKGLAEALGIPRNLIWSSVTVLVEPEDERHFVFDFRQLLDKLGPVNTRGRTGEEIAAWFMTGDKYSGAKPIAIHTGSGLVVTVSPGRVENRFVYNLPGVATDSWMDDGVFLRGLLDESYEDRRKLEPPTIDVVVRSSIEGKYGDGYPIWDEEAKKRALYLTKCIEDALKS